LDTDSSNQSTTKTHSQSPTQTTNRIPTQTPSHSTAQAACQTPGRVNANSKSTSISYFLTQAPSQHPATRPARCNPKHQRKQPDHHKPNTSANTHFKAIANSHPESSCVSHSAPHKLHKMFWKRKVHSRCSVAPCVGKLWFVGRWNAPTHVILLPHIAPGGASLARLCRSSNIKLTTFNLFVEP
jgi:hypothetical protein